MLAGFLSRLQQDEEEEDEEEEGKRLISIKVSTESVNRPEE